MINFGAGNITWESRNHLLNGGVEVWSGGPTVAPDSWAREWGVSAGTVARESSITKNDLYSAAITCANSVGAYCQLTQSVHATLGINYWKGKSVTMGAWIWCAANNVACVAIADGISAGYSAYHTGTSAWQRLSVTYTINAAATALTACLQLYRDTSVHVAYFDQAALVESSQTLGKTFGGGTVELSELSYKGVRSQNLTSTVTGGEGVIHMFQWNNSVGITNNSTIRDYGKLTIACNNMTLVMDYCKLYLSGGLSFGQFQQQPFDLKFSFKKSPDTGNVITIS
jgi:hypothetical protein